MRLQRLELKNLQQFSSLKIDFSSATAALPFTVFFGEQNAGKTTILKHLFQGLSWFAGRHKDLRGVGIIIIDQDIQLDAKQATIEIQVQYPKELGVLAADDQATAKIEGECHWQIHKAKSTSATIGLSRAETTDLEQLVTRYQQQLEQDPLFSTPCICYYPIERFVHEVNLQVKNTSSSLFPLQNAYDLVNLTFTTFLKFFEWLREIHDLENAQSAQLLKQYLNPETRFHTQEQLNEVFSQLEQAHRLAPQRCLNSLRSTIRTVLPEIRDIYIEFQPKLQLMVQYHEQQMPFLQLSQSLRTWIALVGDIVRRLCILNPNSLYPCLEGEGIVLIDEIDTQLDEPHRQNIISRLHRAFPRLQFIVSAMNHDVIEPDQEIECFQLKQQKATKLDLNAHQLKLQSIYQSLSYDIAHETLPDAAEKSLFADTKLSLDEMIGLIEQFNEQEQAQLLQHLKKSSQ